jgi:hypothetical protein
VRTGTWPRVARDRHPAVQTSPKAVRGSRDRGCNDHRILRRVPVDGRHSGSSRGVVFHETALRVVSALFRILRPTRRGQKPKRVANRQLPRRRERREEAKGRDRSVRGSVALAPREENARARHPGREANRVRGLVRTVDLPKRSSGVVKRSVPRSSPYGAQDSVGCPRCESGESEPGTHEVRVHAVRLGGRNRLDASRVFSAGRSQGLLAREGASQEEVRSTA